MVSELPISLFMTTMFVGDGPVSAADEFGRFGRWRIRSSTGFLPENRQNPFGAATHSVSVTCWVRPQTGDDLEELRKECCDQAAVG
jgi:hypothetical protein